MELLEVMENYNPWWFSEFKDNSIMRDSYLSRMEKQLKTKQITLLLGLRRIGKTTLLKQLISKLQHKVSPEKILYLSFDHPLLSNYSLGDIIKEFRKRNELRRREKIFLFLDEILYGKDLLQWIKVINDNENVKVYATSSSMLKDQKALLTGRTSTIRVKPLSFKEYLLFRGKRTDEAHLLERYFTEYLRDGGIPQYILSKDVNYLIELADDILKKDVSLKYRVNYVKLKELFLLLLSRIGKPITYSKLSKVLSIKEETVESYLSLLSSTELIYIVYRYSKSYNERIYSPKKIYLGDVGFRYAFTGSFSLGSNFENLLFLQILEKDPLYFLEKGVEIDFIAGKEVFECKFNRELSEKQESLINRLKKRGYKINIVDSWRFFL